MTHPGDTRHHTRRLGLAALTAAVAASLVLAIPAAADAKKGGGKAGGKVEITKVVNTQIPDLPPPPPGPVVPQVTPLLSMIEVGKQQKGLRVRDVNVTVQTLGVTGTEPGTDLDVELRAPSGQVSELFAGLEGYPGMPAISIGPLTLDDEAPLNLGDNVPLVSTDLFVPWNGRATPFDPLAVMDNDPVTGIWTLIVRDFDDGALSNLVLWRLTILTGKPFKTK